MRRRTAMAALFIGFGAVVGCGGGDKLSTVSGEVKVDGKPLSKGVISYSINGKAATANVENGVYTLKTAPGLNRVVLSAPVVTGKIKEYDGPTAPTMDVTEESLPDKCNVKSELTADVAPGSFTKDWSVESKKKAH